jgi:hypothetical protein
MVAAPMSAELKEGLTVKLLQKELLDHQNIKQHFLDLAGNLFLQLKNLLQDLL